MLLVYLAADIFPKNRLKAALQPPFKKGQKVFTSSWLPFLTSLYSNYKKVHSQRLRKIEQLP